MAKKKLLDNFFSGGKLLKYDKGEVILNNYAEPDGVYQISSGFVKVYSIGSEGEEHIHIIYEVGDIFPLAWAFLNRRHELFYEALGTCKLRRVSRDSLISFTRQSTDNSFQVLLQLAEQFDAHILLVDSLEQRHVEEKVATGLSELARRFGEKKGRGISIRAPVTHQLLADSVNLTRESVTREMGKLQKNKIIRFGRRKITILNIKRLLP